MSESKNCETSIVIRAFNEERWLPQVMEAIDRQRYRDFEVILVDSGSVDRTRDIAAAHGARIVRLRSDDFTFGHSLNLGIRAARGAYVAIISAHAIPTSDRWLELLIAPLREEGTAMVFGGQVGHQISKFSETQDFRRVFHEKPQWMQEANFFVNNANSAIRRSLWEEYPFDEGLPGLEDADWAQHWMWDDAWKVRYEPEASVIHVHTESWAQVRHRFHREGMAGRWAGIRLIRHIPGEILRETWWTTLDLFAAARKRPAAMGEVLRYRYNKTLGIVKGILDSRSLENPSARADFYYEQSYPAVVIKGRRQASLEHRPMPTVNPGEILVRVAYTGMCGTDQEILEGRLGYYKTGQAKYPIVPGHETVGTVVGAGTKVTTFKEGDRVVVECIQGCGTCDHCRRDDAIVCRERREVGVMGKDGGYARYLVASARYAHKVPDGLGLAAAALTEPLAVVIKGLRRLGAAGPDVGPRKCAVVGAGAIGNLVAQVLALRGHAVTVFDRNAKRLAALPSAVSGASNLSNLDQFDWLVDATGDQSVLNALLSGSRTGATLLLLGLPYSSQPFSFESIVAFDKTVVGSVGSSARDFDDALTTLPRLHTAAFLESAFPLEDYEQAWATMRSGEHLKVMLKVDAAAT